MAVIHHFFWWSLLVTALTGVDSKCLTYGICLRTEGQYVYNCYKNSTDPVALQNSGADQKTLDKALTALRKFCPFLMTDEGTQELCCHPDQVILMTDGFENLTPFKRCPTCLQNLLGVFCNFGCSANQTDFMTNVIVKQTDDGKDYAESTEVIINEEYANKVYESCKEVSVPSSGGAVIEVTCGSYGRALCNPERWFDFMNDPDQNTLAPFRTTWHLTDQQQALIYTARNCDERWENASSCSCVDCPIKCAGGVYPDIHTYYYIFGEVNSIAFSLILTTILMAAMITCVVFMKKRADERGTTYTGIEKLIVWIKRSGENLHKKLENIFRTLGETMAIQKFKVLAMCTAVVCCLSGGIYFMDVTTDPVKLWASYKSTGRTQKDFYDQHFGPFYRTNQVFIKAVGRSSFNVTITRSSASEDVVLGPGFDKEFLNEVFRLQQKIENIEFNNTDESGQVVKKTLANICFSPLRTIFSGNRTINDCAIFSLLGLFENDVTQFNEDLDKSYERIIGCIQAPYTPRCLAPYGGPILPGLALGGASKANSYRDALGVSLTFLTKNSLEEADLKDTEIWEKKFIELLKDYDENERPDFFDIAYSAERSIQDEIVSLSKGTAFTIAISYLVMFLYISIALGKMTTCSEMLLESKIMVGLAGVVIVFSSVTSAIGICAYVGMTTTLLTIEVIPFFVLAVGVDNMFIIVQNHQRKLRNNNVSVVTSIGDTMAQVGPSMLLTTSSELFCFAIATLSDMPAVYTFAVFATLAVAFDFIFQMTAFVAILALDEERYRNKRMDILCCIRMKNAEANDSPGFLERIWINLYVPCVMGVKTRCVVVIVFLITFCSSLWSAPFISVGLDQKLAMPEGSHVLKYFEFLADLLGTGPPIYWVTKGDLNYFDPEIIKRMCGGSNCDENSLSVQLYTAAMSSDITYMSIQANSWIDDFEDWSESEKCCRYFPSNNSFCPHLESSCKSCDFNQYNLTKEEYFKRFLPHFLNDNPDTSGTCAKGGHAAYSSSISYVSNDDGTNTILASNVMSYHSVLKTPADYIEALRYARYVAKNLTETLDVPGVEIFPYSIFYVFYEQYLSIWTDAINSLVFSYGIVFAITFFLTGFSIFAAFCITLSVIMITTNLMGMMWLWDINLNAISLVNLVMSIGIGVEFCGHMVYHFENSKESGSVNRARDALENTGLSVISGITLTKFSGIFVLAFANSQIFKIYYFRMYLGMVLLGALHSVVFLPALLSLLGHVKYRKPTVTLPEEGGEKGLWEDSRE